MKEWTRVDVEIHCNGLCPECLGMYRFCDPQCTDCLNRPDWRRPLHGKTHCWKDGESYICRHCAGTGRKVRIYATD